MHDPHAVVPQWAHLRMNVKSITLPHRHRISLGMVTHSLLLLILGEAVKFVFEFFLFGRGFAVGLAHLVHGLHRVPDLDIDHRSEVDDVAAAVRANSVHRSLSAMTRSSGFVLKASSTAANFPSSVVAPFAYQPRT